MPDDRPEQRYHTLAIPTDAGFVKRWRRGIKLYNIATARVSLYSSRTHADPLKLDAWVSRKHRLDCITDDLVLDFLAEALGDYFHEYYTHTMALGGRAVLVTTLVPRDVWESTSD